MKPMRTAKALRRLNEEIGRYEELHGMSTKEMRRELSEGRAETLIICQWMLADHLRARILFNMEGLDAGQGRD